MKPRKLILSLCDYSGTWSQPYRDDKENYEVWQVDPKLSAAINNFRPITVQVFLKIFVTDANEDLLNRVHGMLMAPPCTHFSVSGAQYWKAKDADGRTDEMLEIVDTCIAIKNACPNLKWWVLENPVGRLPKLCPNTLGKPILYFQPHHYAAFADDPEVERYTKKTGLWGNFNSDLPKANLEPIKVCKQGSWIQKLGGKSEKTKELRSMTPQGFARAFYMANP